MKAIIVKPRRPEPSCLVSSHKIHFDRRHRQTNSLDESYIIPYIMLISTPKLISLFSVLAAVAASETEEEYKPFQFVFDHNYSGAACDEAVKSNDEEDFRLFCVNQRQSFQQCALSCSEILHFDSSLGVCRSDRCSFYDMSFPMTKGPDLSMSKMAPGKVTVFSFSPLWEGFGQYNYELLEHVRNLYPETIEAILLPIDVHDYTLEHPRFELMPYGEHKNYMDKKKQVHFLPEVTPHEVGGHPFLRFIQSLLHREGAKNFDVYTDRVTTFVVSSDGTLAERLVAPTLETLQAAIEKYGGGQPVSARQAISGAQTM